MAKSKKPTGKKGKARGKGQTKRVVRPYTRSSGPVRGYTAANPKRGPKRPAGFGGPAPKPKPVPRPIPQEPEIEQEQEPTTIDWSLVIAVHYAFAIGPKPVCRALEQSYERTIEPEHVEESSYLRRVRIGTTRRGNPRYAPRRKRIFVERTIPAETTTINRIFPSKTFDRIAKAVAEDRAIADRWGIAERLDSIRDAAKNAYDSDFDNAAGNGQDYRNSMIGVSESTIYLSDAWIVEGNLWLTRDQNLIEIVPLNDMLGEELLADEYTKRGQHYYTNSNGSMFDLVYRYLAKCPQGLTICEYHDDSRKDTYEVSIWIRKS